MLNNPIKTRKGDNAETYNFKNHKPGAGQRNRRNNRLLSSTDRRPGTTARNSIILRYMPVCRFQYGGKKGGSTKMIPKAGFNGTADIIGVVAFQKKTLGRLSAGKPCVVI